MTRPTFALFATKRFWPLFLGQFIGAFGDNLFRSALVALVTYKLAEAQGFAAGPTVSLAIGIFMLPYFLFSSIAGPLADRMDKATLMRRLKALEIPLLGAAALALLTESVPLMLGILFLVGTQSAFYSPVKYAILPQHLRQHELLPGNALIGAGTFLAILIGSLAGNNLALVDNGEAIVGSLMVALALLGFITALFIPSAPPENSTLPLPLNIVRETGTMLKEAFAQADLRLVLLGHAWFWFIGSLYLGQIAPVAKDVLNASEGVYSLFFALFSVGIGLGSLLVSRLLKGQADGRYLPFAALAMGVFGTDLAMELWSFARPETMLTLATFFEHPGSWRITADLTLLAVAGGAYIIPLSSLLQARAKPERRARTIAAANICDALAMVVASAMAALLLAVGLSIPLLWLGLALGSFVAAVLIAALIPQTILKSTFRHLLRALYDVKVEGLENLTNAGPRAVIVANHVSLLDGLILGTFLPGRPLFAVNSQIAEAWWVKPFLLLIEAYRIDPLQPMALKGLIHKVAANHHCVIFPEGRITTTGSLMKINEGPGLIAAKADAPIVPIRIDGAQYSTLSYLKGKVRRHWFPKIRLTILPPERFDLPEGLPARARRQLAGQRLYDLMSNLIFETSPIDETIVDALIAARTTHGGNKPVLEDKDRKPIGYTRLLTAAVVLGRRLTKTTSKGERVGVLLPNVNACAITIIALQFFGRVPAMLNFTAGPANLQAAAKAGTIQTLITARAFIAQAKLEHLVAALSPSVRILYLEDIRTEIGILQKLGGLLTRPFFSQLHQRQKIAATDAAIVLFTSGSEGTPKGVVLSHRNLLANRYQVGARIDFSPSDIVLNALPLFHSFGLTGGLLIPLLGGARTVLYPSPLHYRLVPLLAYDCNATILFGTDTFLTGYARTAHPYDFYSLRFICAGAERVREETRRIYADKFGVRIFEGYGTTETAPVLAINTPLYQKVGTVGRLLPGMKAKLSPVPGVPDGGRLSVAGPNVMMGYLTTKNPGVLEYLPEAEGHLWHDTGDIVSIDAAGFITIKGRAKRFAKIAGEMVALPAVEDFISSYWPGFAHAVVAIPDSRKGEQLVLVTTKPDSTASDLVPAAKAAGLADLMVPKALLRVEALPLLGSGKTDYVELQKIVLSKLS